jgi:membrane protease YdiL (CAAX protease family)
MNKVVKEIKEVFKGSYGLFIYLLIQLGGGLLFRNYINSNNYYLVNFIIISIEIITLILLMLLNKDRIKKDFIDFDKNYKKYLEIGFIAWLIGLIIMIVSNGLINGFILKDIAVNEAIDRSVLNTYPLYSIIAMILFGPFIEELTFRCGYKDNITNKALYYIVTILLFSGFHVLNGITNPLALLYFIPYGALAFAFSYTFDKTDNIFTTTIIHTLHNTISILILITIGAI